MYFRSDTVCYLKKTSNATGDTGKFDKFYTTKTNLIRKNTKAQFKITKMLVCRENYFLIPKVFQIMIWTTHCILKSVKSFAH